jgi:hypothetical protein
MALLELVFDFAFTVSSAALLCKAEEVSVGLGRIIVMLLGLSFQEFMSKIPIHIGINGCFMLLIPTKAHLN